VRTTESGCNGPGPKGRTQLGASQDLRPLPLVGWPTSLVSREKWYGGGDGARYPPCGWSNLLNCRLRRLNRKTSRNVHLIKIYTIPQVAANYVDYYLIHKALGLL